MKLVSEIIRQDDVSVRLVPASVSDPNVPYKFVDSDFVEVRCEGREREGGNGTNSTKWGSFLAAPRSNVESPQKGLGSSDKLFNVLLWGVDSLSRKMFIKKLPLTYSFLLKTLGGVVLEGYNMVGDETPQALIPILTGQIENEFPETRIRPGLPEMEYVNVRPFIWDVYKEKGYLTGYMEDLAKLRTFAYRLRGFNKAPTDFYMRPYFLASESEYKFFRPFCMGFKSRHKVFMNYVRDVLRFRNETPKFVVSYHGELSQNNRNRIQGADEDLREFFQDLRSSGNLNNTIIIVLSEHSKGLSSYKVGRRPKQKKHEERMPMLMLIFPPLFQKFYRRAFKNVLKNSQVLTTPLDIHATLKDLLTLPSTPNLEFVKSHKRGNRSLSLFRKIFPDRSCEDAFIDPRWCTYLDWHVLKTDLPVVLRAAKKFVGFLNDYLASETILPFCAPLTLGRVLWAANLLPNQDLPHLPVNTTAISRITLLLKVETLPGRGQFQVFIHHDLIQDLFELKISDVVRINKRDSEANCVQHRLVPIDVRNFCFCAEVS